MGKAEERQRRAKSQPRTVLDWDRVKDQLLDNVLGLFIQALERNSVMASIITAKGIADGAFEGHPLARTWYL